MVAGPTGARQPAGGAGRSDSAPSRASAQRRPYGRGMRSPGQHFTRCVIAGIVALLPLGGAVLAFSWIEGLLSEGGLREQPFYFPGLGLILALIGVYAIGLFVTTFLGRWLLRTVDRALEGLPGLGAMYQSIKEVLGYDTTRERFFQGVVLVEVGGGQQLGLITGREDIDGEALMMVFVTGSPNPSAGRLLLVPESRLRRVDVRVAQAMRSLVAIGKAPLAARN
jgi:uncharacterized membrane protein